MNNDKSKSDQTPPQQPSAPKRRIKGSHRNKKPPKLTWI